MREARFWLLHLLSGAALVVLLGGHLLLMHLPGLLSNLGLGDPAPLDFGSVAQRSQSLAWQLFYIILVLFALYHGLYGLRGILLEILSARGKSSRALTLILILVGLFALLFAVWVLISF